MNIARRAIASATAFSVLVCAPGIFPYAAAAQAVEAPRAAESATAPEWIPALGQTLSDMAGLVPSLAVENTSSVLGQIRLEAALNPKTSAVAVLAARLPQNADSPQKLAALSPRERIAVISQAAKSASRDLSDQAALLLENQAARQSQPSNRELKLLSRLDSLRFYLPTEQSQAVHSLYVRHIENRAMERARALAKRLAGKLSPYGASDPTVNAGIKLMFASLKPHLEKSVGERQNFVQNALAPQAIETLNQASQSLTERGILEQTLWASLIKDHRKIFGSIADPQIVKVLRKTGQWTEFVAAVSLAAAQKIAEKPDADAILSKAGANYDLRMPLPPWHPLSERFKTVDEFLASHGSPAEEPLGKGLRLGKIMGIPVIIRPGTAAAMALISLEMAQQTALALPGASAIFLAANGFATAALIYASVVAHEFGHALTARAFGVKTHKITINVLGGAAFVDHELRRPLPDFLIAFAGPAVNLMLSAVFFLPALLHFTVPATLAMAAAPFILTNAVLAAFNLLPILPMDGGLMLRAALSAITRNDYWAARAAEKTAKIAAVLSFMGAAALLFAGQGSLAVLLGFLGLVGMFPNVLLHPGTILAGDKKISAKKT
ncbi:MAG: site-2 protease family protein [Elusimicrobiota bacterium]